MGGFHSNFHSHCTFCDGRSHPEDFLKFALSKKFRAYGFSSHSPLPFETYWNMSKMDMPDYLAEIERLKKKYTGDVEVYLGLEIDYLDPSYNATTPYFQSLSLDYCLSSIHFLSFKKPLLEENMVCIDGRYSDFEKGLNEHFGGDIRRITEFFFESSMKMVEIGGFDIVGHIDKIYMNGRKHPDFDIHADWYQKPFLTLLDFVAEKGLIVEINCKYKNTKGLTFPHVDSYKELHKRHIPIIVNSDCHDPHLVNDGRNETLALLKDAGHISTRELVNGVWQEIMFND